ncbi:MAG: antibiotic acetyltransferase, partial [Proteobacteria bacterium]|nr:antibiotic acetyltransferase [Pseudomonadota bacterium]
MSPITIRRLLTKLRIIRQPQKLKTLQEKFPQYEIGRWTYGTPTILSRKVGATLKMGAFCSIAGGVKIFLGGEHR